MEIGVHNSHMHGDCELPIQALEIALLGVVYFFTTNCQYKYVSFMSCEINLEVSLYDSFG